MSTTLTFMLPIFLLFPVYINMNIFQTSELMDICSGPTVAIAEVFSIPQHLLDSRPRDWRPEREGIYETMYKWSADRFRKHFRMSQGW